MTSTEATAEAPGAATASDVTLTEAAAAKVRALLDQEGRDDLRLRIAVQPGGCSGLQYQLFFDERSLDGDVEIRPARRPGGRRPDERAVPGRCHGRLHRHHRAAGLHDRQPQRRRRLRLRQLLLRLTPAERIPTGSRARRNFSAVGVRPPAAARGSRLQPASPSSWVASARDRSRCWVDRHRPPDALPWQVLRPAARRPAAQRVAVLPGRRPGHPARRRGAQHLLRHGAARRRAGAGRARWARTSTTTGPGSSATASTATTCMSRRSTTPRVSSAPPTTTCARSAPSTPAR